MKKLLITVVVLVGGLVAYNFATTGEFSVVPSFTLSDEEQSVEDLQDRFTAAKKQFTQALRMAGMSGMDTTGDVESARVSVRKISAELKKVRDRLSEQKAKQSAQTLADLIQEFNKQLS